MKFVIIYKYIPLFIIDTTPGVLTLKTNCSNLISIFKDIRNYNFQLYFDIQRYTKYLLEFGILYTRINLPIYQINIFNSQGIKINSRVGIQ